MNKNIFTNKKILILPIIFYSLIFILMTSGTLINAAEGKSNINWEEIREAYNQFLEEKSEVALNKFNDSLPQEPLEKNNFEKKDKTFEKSV